MWMSLARSSIASTTMRLHSCTAGMISAGLTPVPSGSRSRTPRSSATRTVKASSHGRARLGCGRRSVVLLDRDQDLGTRGDHRLHFAARGKRHVLNRLAIQGIGHRKHEALRGEANRHAGVLPGKAFGDRLHGGRLDDSRIEPHTGQAQPAAEAFRHRLLGQPALLDQEVPERYFLLVRLAEADFELLGRQRTRTAERRFQLLFHFFMLAGPHPRSRRLDSRRSLAAAAGASFMLGGAPPFDGAGAPPPAPAASRIRAPRRLKALARGGSTRVARSPRPQALLLCSRGPTFPMAPGPHPRRQPRRAYALRGG